MAPPALQRFRHDAAMLLVCAIWGANFTVTKLAFAELSPLAFTAVRFAAGCLLLFLVVRAVEGPAEWPRRPQVLRLAWLGLIGNTAYQLGFVLGLAHSSATNTALIISASPAMVAILGAALGLERTTSRTRLGIGLGICGVVLIVLTRKGAHLQAAPGDLFTVGALVAWSVYTVGLRRVTGMSSLRLTAWTTYFGTPALVLAAVPELKRVQWAAVGLATWGALAYAVVLSLIVGYLIWNRSVRAVGGTRTAIYMCVTPLVALFVAWAALGERPTWLHAAGAALIVGGVVLTRLPGSLTPPPD